MEKLTKLNHAVWAAQMLAAIRGARLVGHIDGKTAAPSTEVNQEQADKTVKKVPNPVYEEWYAADQQLLGYIFSSLSREILNQVVDSRTAAQAWRAIGKLFCSQTRTRSLNNRLALQTTLKGAMSITEYFGKMKVLSDDIAATGKPLDEEDLIAYILNGLDGDYDSVVSAIGMKSELISVMEVYSQLLNFENILQLRQEGIAAAHAASRGRGGFIPRSGGNGGGSAAAAALGVVVVHRQPTVVAVAVAICRAAADSSSNAQTLGRYAKSAISGGMSRLSVGTILMKTMCR